MEVCLEWARQGQPLGLYDMHPDEIAGLYAISDVPARVGAIQKCAEDAASGSLSLPQMRVPLMLVQMQILDDEVAFAARQAACAIVSHLIWRLGQ